MEHLKNYTINAAQGPFFERPNIGNSIPYLSNANEYKAASITGAWDIVDKVLTDIGEMSPSFSKIKTQITELATCWNECIKVNGQGMQYLADNDIKQDLNTLTEACENGKSKCDSILEGFAETIEEINQYISTLIDNYNEYNKIRNSINRYNEELHSIDPINNQSAISRYQTIINSLQNQLNNYQEVKDITNSGKWVV